MAATPFTGSDLPPRCFPFHRNRDPSTYASESCCRTGSEIAAGRDDSTAIGTRYQPTAGKNSLAAERSRSELADHNLLRGQI